MRDSWWIPRFLLPDFTWHAPKCTFVSGTTPPVPRVPRPIVRRFWGYIHWSLYHLSKLYCHWLQISFDGQLIQLPFGLILKWHNRTRVEEAIGMQIARAAGIPAPKVLSVGQHPPGSSFWPVSILMTRLRGSELINIDMPFEEDLEGPWLGELKKCLDAMRTWDSPYGQRICSPINTSLKSSRVPKHVMGPFENEAALHEYLLKPASSHSFASREKYEETLALAKRIQEKPHRVVFTHGDFKEHNVLVDDDGNLTGWLDWESAGWYPEFWEFTTARRMGRDTWWGQAVSSLGGDRHAEELESDIALNQLTVDSYVAF